MFLRQLLSSLFCVLPHLCSVKSLTNIFFFAVLPVLTTTGKECKFPFRQGGRIHHDCITIASSRPWWVLISQPLLSGSPVLVTQTITNVRVITQELPHTWARQTWQVEVLPHHIWFYSDTHSQATALLYCTSLSNRPLCHSICMTCPQVCISLKLSNTLVFSIILYIAVMGVICWRDTLRCVMGLCSGI